MTVKPTLDQYRQECDKMMSMAAALFRHVKFARDGFRVHYLAELKALLVVAHAWCKAMPDKIPAEHKPFISKLQTWKNKFNQSLTATPPTSFEGRHLECFASLKKHAETQVRALESKKFQSETEQYDLWTRTMYLHVVRLWRVTDGLGSLFREYVKLEEPFQMRMMEIMMTDIVELFNEFMEINWNTLIAPYNYDDSTKYPCFDVYRKTVTEVLGKSIKTAMVRCNSRAMSELASRPTQATSLK